MISETNDRFDQELRALATRLNELEPDERLLLLEKLREYTNFCFHCGWTYPFNSGVCHCFRDE